MSSLILISPYDVSTIVTPLFRRIGTCRELRGRTKGTLLIGDGTGS